MRCRVCDRTRAQVSQAARNCHVPGFQMAIRWRATIGNKRDEMCGLCQLWVARIMGVAL